MRIPPNFLENTRYSLLFFRHFVNETQPDWIIKLPEIAFRAELLVPKDTGLMISRRWTTHNINMPLTLKRITIRTL